MFGVITDLSLQTCGICGATPNIINNSNEIWKRVPKAQTSEFGISTLHAWIRCFEALFIITGVLPIKIFSEENLESRIEDFQKYKEYNTKMFSSEKTQIYSILCYFPQTH